MKYCSLSIFEFLSSFLFLFFCETLNALFLPESSYVLIFTNTQGASSLFPSFYQVFCGLVCLFVWAVSVPSIFGNIFVHFLNNFFPSGLLAFSIFKSFLFPIALLMYSSSSSHFQFHVFGTLLLLPRISVLILDVDKDSFCG